jgi:hypothetical protein
MLHAPSAAPLSAYLVIISLIAPGQLSAWALSGWVSSLGVMKRGAVSSIAPHWNSD